MCSRNEIAQIESKYFPNDSPYGLFRQLKYITPLTTCIIIMFLGFILTNMKL